MTGVNFPSSEAKMNFFTIREKGEFANGSVVFVFILLSYAHSSHWREWLHRGMRRGSTNTARTHARGGLPRAEDCARRRGRDSGRPQPAERQRSETESLCSGCGNRPGHQFGPASGRTDEHLPWRDTTRGHAEQHRRVPRDSTFAGHGNRSAAGGAAYRKSELRRSLHPYPPEQLKVMRTIFPWVTDDYDKIPAERIVMNDRELPGTVLRLPMVYGPGDPVRSRNSTGLKRRGLQPRVVSWVVVQFEINGP